VVGSENADIGGKGFFPAFIAAAFPLDELGYALVQILFQSICCLLIKVITLEKGVD